MKNLKRIVFILEMLRTWTILEYANFIRKMRFLLEGELIASSLSFKNIVGKFAPRFTGYFYAKILIAFILRNKISCFLFREQDSQEFSRYLLQGLSEDNNRVRPKPSLVTVNEKEEERVKHMQNLYVCIYRNQSAKAKFYIARSI